MTFDIDDDLTPDDIGLRPDETVCRGCNLAHFRRLPECPTCKELTR